MRHKIVVERVTVPDKYRYFRVSSWPSHSAWHQARWKWAHAQPLASVSGSDCYGNPWRYSRTVLGDATDEAREARECRIMDFAD